jgi:Dockerin type I domain
MGTWDWSSDNAAQPNFAPLWNQEFGTDLWRTNDGSHWQFVSKTGLGDGNNTGSRSFATTPFGLYMGTARSIGGTQVFNVDNSTLDYNHDGVIDRKDIALMSGRLYQKALPNDPMDLNQDGVINALDIQLLSTQCTCPANWADR